MILCYIIGLIIEVPEKTEEDFNEVLITEDVEKIKLA
jgi:hypothetical protein